MGYTTDFEGKFKITGSLTPDQVKYIQTFSKTRRMKRNVEKLQELYDGEHGLPGGDYGLDGEFFAYDDGWFGQNRDESIIDYNSPSETQPGLWCNWTISDDGSELMWNGREKFYCYEDWLIYMIEKFFKPWNCVLNGTIAWQGEDVGDWGELVVIDNELSVQPNPRYTEL